MAKQIVEELVGVLGLDVNDASFKKGDQALGKTGVSFSHVAAMATAAAGAVQAAISGMVLSFAESADASGKFASRIGVSVEGLTSLRHAVEQTSTATGQQFNTGLQRMTRRISEANAGSKGLADGLKELGLEAAVLAKMSPDEQFLAIADAMKEVENSGDQTRLTMKFFDSEAVELVNTLRLGSDAIRDLQKDARELGIVLSDEDAKAAAEFNDQLDIAQKSLGGVKNEIGRNLLPVFTELAVSFSEFVKDNKELIQSGLLRFFEGFAFVMKAAAVATGLFLAFKLGAALTGMMIAMRGLTFATLAFNASALLIPIAIGLFAAALVLIGDEIVTFINHGDKADSFMGRLAKKFPLVGDAIELILFPIKRLGNFLGESVGFIVQLIASGGDLQSAFNNLSIADGLKQQFKEILDSWNAFKGGASSFFKENLGIDLFGGGDDLAGEAQNGATVGAAGGNYVPTLPEDMSLPNSFANTGAIPQMPPNVTNVNVDATGMDRTELKATIDSYKGQDNADSARTNKTGMAY